MVSEVGKSQHNHVMNQQNINGALWIGHTGRKSGSSFLIFELHEKREKMFFPTIWYAAVSPDTFSIAPRGPLSLQERYLLNVQQVKYTWESLDHLYLRAICTCWGAVIAAANPTLEEGSLDFVSYEMFRDTSSISNGH